MPRVQPIENQSTPVLFDDVISDNDIEMKPMESSPEEMDIHPTSFVEPDATDDTTAETDYYAESDTDQVFATPPTKLEDEMYDELYAVSQTQFIKFCDKQERDPDSDNSEEEMEHLRRIAEIPAKVQTISPTTKDLNSNWTQEDMNSQCKKAEKIIHIKNIEMEKKIIEKRIERQNAEDDALAATKTRQKDRESRRARLYKNEEYSAKQKNISLQSKTNREQLRNLLQTHMVEDVFDTFLPIPTHLQPQTKTSPNTN